MDWKFTIRDFSQKKIGKVLLNSHEIFSNRKDVIYEANQCAKKYNFSNYVLCIYCKASDSKDTWGLFTLI